MYVAFLVKHIFAKKILPSHKQLNRNRCMQAYFSPQNFKILLMFPLLGSTYFLTNCNSNVENSNKKQYSILQGLSLTTGEKKEM
jgi:hypothetical protein